MMDQMSKSSNPTSAAKVAHLALGCAPVLLAAAFVASPAAAQNVGQQFQRNKNTSVRGRAHPEYDALGIRSGAFLIFPKVTVDGTYDEQHLCERRHQGRATSSRRRPPTCRPRPNGRATGWRAFGRVSRSEYASIGDQSNTTYSAGATGQLDVQRDFALTGVAQFQHGVEARTASGTRRAARDPIVYELSEPQPRRRQGLQPLPGPERVQLRRLELQVVPEQSRPDRSARIIATRATTRPPCGSTTPSAPTPPCSCAASRSGGSSRTGRTGGRDRPRLDGYTATAGADFELTSLMRGQIQGGYLDYKFDNPGTGNVKSFSADASIEYFPTQLLTLTFTGSRAVGDTGPVLDRRLPDHQCQRPGRLRAAAQPDHHRPAGLRPRHLPGHRPQGQALERLGGLHLPAQPQPGREHAVLPRQDQTSNGLAAGPDYGINRFTVSLTLQRVKTGASPWPMVLLAL